MGDVRLRELERRAALGDAGARVALQRSRERAGQQRGALGLIAGVFANAHALRAVLADLDGQGVVDVACLGSVVGWGPDPEECLDLVRARCRVVLQGAWDAHVVGSREQVTSSEPALHVAEWTRRRLRPRWFARRPVRARWELLAGASATHREDGLLLVHGTPGQPWTGVVDVSTEVWPDPGHLFQGVEGLAVCGGSGRAGVVTPAGPPRPAEALAQARWELALPALVVPGWVGRPPAPRQAGVATYALLRGGELEWRRVAYDAAAVAERMNGLGFPELLVNAMAGTARAGFDPVSRAARARRAGQAGFPPEYVDELLRRAPW